MHLKRLWIGLGLALLILFNPWTKDLERWTIDERFQWRGPRPPLSDLIIVKIDAPTLQWANTPFWGFKPLYEEFLLAMASVQARAVFLDLIFDVSPDKIIQELVLHFCEANKIPFPGHLLNRLGFDLPFRQALVKARQAGVKVVLGYNKEQQGMAATNDLIHMTTPEDQKGFLNMINDSDHVIRRALITAHDPQSGKWFPSVARVMAWHIASECVLTAQPEIMINYAGPAQTYPTESFMNVINTARQNPVALERFRGKTVLLGLGDITDLKAVPWKGFMNGVEIHAQITENLVRGNWLRTLSPWVSPLFMILVFPLQGLIFHRRGWIGGLLTFSIAIVWITLCQALFHNNLLLPCAAPLLFLFGNGLAEWVRLFLHTEGERRFIRDMFGRYVNDQVINAIMLLPRDEVMKGHRQHVCVLFIDIRGFTTYSESRPPDQIVEFLNRYFASLTEIIMRNDGVVDKFLGDGLMAFFNAPIPRKTYLEDAVSACLEIRETLAAGKIRTTDAAFALKVGMALHAGDAVIGNIGSERKMEFTAIGDTVNTTSRLESLNKDYGTDIIVSDAVMSGTSEAFEWKFLADQQIRGKEKPLPIYTLVGRRPGRESGNPGGTS